MTPNTPTPGAEEVAFHFVPGAVKDATRGMKSADLWKVPVDRLRIKEGFNPRIMTDTYRARIRAICDSIKANGFYADQPLAGYVARENGESYVIITNGHTRYAALQMAIAEGAEIEVVPVVTKPNGTSMSDLTVALVTSNSGAPLTPYEVAVVCKRLIGYQMTEDEIATRIGVTKTQVRNYLMLMSAPHEIHQLVIEERISATLAIETYRKHGIGAMAILRECVATAEDAGKERATRKDVTRQTQASAAPRFSKTQMQRGISYVVEHKLAEDDRILNLLAHLSGSTVDAIRKLLEQPASEAHTPNPKVSPTDSAHA